MFRSETKVEIDNKNDDITFQIIDWQCRDVIREIYDDFEEDIKKELLYIITLFGVTKEGHSVALNVTKFMPYYFVKLNKDYTSSELKKLKGFIESQLPYMSKDGIKSLERVNRKDFWGFTNNIKQPFLKITCKNLQSFRESIKILNRSIKIPGFNGGYPVKFKLYESNIEPHLRFIHQNDLEACGWVKVNKGKYIINDLDELDTKCQINANVNFKNVLKHKSNSMASFIVASFDIECDSSHGDFPMAKKDYRKVSSDLYEIHRKLKDKITPDSLIRDHIASELRIFFTEEPGQIMKAYTEHKVNLDRLYETKILPLKDEIFDTLEGKIEYKKDRKGMSNYDVMIHNLTDLLNRNLPRLQGDKIIQIGTTLHKYGEKDCYMKHIVTLNSCDPIEGSLVESYNDEKKLLIAWRQFIDKVDPDVVTGYNIFGFDFEYVYDRSCDLGIEDKVCKLSRYIEEPRFPPRFKSYSLSSSALGDNIMKFINMEGRVMFDLMKEVQRNHKIDSYKLDNVAHHFIGMNKNDVSPQDIFRLQKGNSADRKTIAEYCIQDCALCNKLTIKLETLTNNIGMANVCNVPLSYIFMRGQGIKIFSLISKKCREEEFLIPTVKYQYDKTNEETEEGYEGAIVLDPTPGIYIDEPISVLDYASLYPSSIISENISHDTYVEKGSRFYNLPEFKYVDITYDKFKYVDGKKLKDGETTCRFVQTKEKGVLPRILQILLKSRKDTRKKIEWKTVKTVENEEFIGLLKEEEDKYVVHNHEEHKNYFINKEDVVEIKNTFDKFEQSVLDGLQLAYKITANSLYGSLGAKTSQIYMKELAASTTAVGRNLIYKAKDFMEKHYDAEIIYGDSVTGYTPVILKINEEIKVDIFENISTYGNNIWIPCIEEGKQTKEACELNNVQCWTEKGWTKIDRIIRHTLVSHKKIIRVHTHTGIVDVTDDHSLLNENSEKISPKDLKIGDCLLQKDINYQELDNNISEEESRIMGMFMGDGTCGKYNTKWGIKYSWNICNSDINLLNYYKSLCEKIYPEVEWKIMNTLESSNVYKLYPKGAIKRFVEIYKILYNENRNKIIPYNILNSTRNVKEEFLKGLYDADGCKKEYTNIRITQKSQISAMCIYMLCKSLGYNVSVNDRTDKDCYRITFSMNNQRKQSNKIKKMREIEYSGYVYDLTTENHQFQAGIGNIIVSNTDSVFVNYRVKEKLGLKNEEALEKSIEIACKASEDFKKTLKEPHNAEYEKTFYPFIIFSKKRYVGNLYEFDVNKFKQKSMGIVLKRRDNANIVKEVYGGVIDIILNEQNISKSIEFLKKTLTELIEGKKSMKSLVVSKTIRATYKNPDQIAHKVLSDRMKLRGETVQVNDRIPYAYIKLENATKDTLQGERIETPEYIEKHNLKIDYEFYITNQIMKPVSQLYSLALDQIEEYDREKDYYDKQYEEILIQKNGDVKKTVDRINTLKEADVRRILFEPILMKIEGYKPKGVRVKKESVAKAKKIETEEEIQLTNSINSMKEELDKIVLERKEEAKRQNKKSIRKSDKEKELESKIKDSKNELKVLKLKNNVIANNYLTEEITKKDIDTLNKIL